MQKRKEKARQVELVHTEFASYASSRCNQKTGQIDRFKDDFELFESTQWYIMFFMKSKGY